MASYSHSRISLFEQCPYKYKLHYIDKIRPEAPEIIETFMGGIVHQVLEKMYEDRKFKKRVSKAILLKFYKDLWEKEYTSDILVAKADQGLTAENYRKMGLEFIENYYDSHKEDDMTVLALETEDRLTLPDGNSWHVKMDKLGCNEDIYFVCDYKTNAKMKTQEEVDEDRQLAMYSIWVKDKFKDAKKVILKWHMLAFDKDITSERTEEQLKKLQEEVMSVIKKIETAIKEKDFPTHVTALCDYCVYKSICPSFKHQTELEVKAEESVKKFKEDDGLKIVDEFAELKTKKKEMEEKEENLKNDLIGFAKQKGVDVVYGSNMKASVKEYEKFSMPDDEDEKAKFIELVKKKGLYDNLSNLNALKISALAVKGELDPELKKKLSEEEAYRISLSKRKDLEEE